MIYAETSPKVLDPARRVRFGILAVVTGIAMGWFLPSSTGPGIFVPIIATLGASALISAGAFPRSLSCRIDIAIAAVLAVIPAFWAAEWIAVICILGACAFAALAVRTPDGWGSFIAASLAPLGRLPLTPGFLFRTYRREQSGGTRLMTSIRGAVIATVLLLVFGALFASADAIFARFISDIFDFDLGSVPARAFCFVIGIALTCGYLMSSTRLRQLWPGPLFAGSWGPLVERAEDGFPIWRLKPTEWTIVLVVLDALFIAFVSIQVTALFGGHEHVLVTSGLTYSQYARSGFFQLMVAGFLTLGVVGAARRWSQTETPKMVARLQWLLGILCIMTLVILASAFERMSLYEQAYGYTRSRYFAYGVILWMAGIFVMVIASHMARRAAWVPRAAVTFSGIALVVFAAIGPDRFIAENNVERFARTQDIDLEYLARLSTDAADAISKLPATIRSCPEKVMSHRYFRPDHWASYNVSRARWRGGVERIDTKGFDSPYACYTALDLMER